MKRGESSRERKKECGAPGLMSRSEDSREREREKEQKQKIQLAHNKSGPVCVYDRGKTRLR